MSQWSSLKQSDLMEGGAGKLFSQVVFGGSHQGSLANVVSGKADVGACDDIDTDTYVSVVSGTASTPGAVYQVKGDAAEPFDAVSRRPVHRPLVGTGSERTHRRQYEPAQQGRNQPRSRPPSPPMPR